MPRGRPRKENLQESNDNINTNVVIENNTENIIPVKGVVSSIKKTKTISDDIGPETKSVKNDSNHAKIIVTWKDSRGKERSTQYIMADMTINENVVEEFNGCRKVTHLHISLDGSVLEKI